MRESQAIKNNTYHTASAFSKKFFGGVIPDLGVYPLAASIMILGFVLNFEVKVNARLNGVVVDCHLNLKHQKGQASFRISKIVDGDNALYVDGKKALKSLTFSQTTDRMDYEVKKFVQNIDLDLFQSISIETARVTEAILKASEIV